MSSMLIHVEREGGKKRRELEEKERRKEERKLKKKQKEEEQKRKEVEKARKAAEREKKRVHTEKERACKAAEREALKAQRCKAKTAPAITRKRAAENTVLSQGSTEVVNGNRARMSVTESESSSNADSHHLLKRARLTVDSTIFTDICCVCFGSYEDDEDTGREWLQCSCDRWIHQDCIIANNSDKLCPLC